MTINHRLRKLEMATGDSNWKLVWLDWKYDSTGNCTGALVKDQMFTLEAGETPERLIERVHQTFGAAVAHWMMLSPTDHRL
jgi:hypothetical protein